MATTKPRKARKGKYGIKKSENGQYYVVQFGKNGEPLNVSEMVDQKDSAWVNARAAKSSAVDSDIVDMTGE